MSNETTDHTLGYALVERVADRLETEFGDDLPVDVRAALNVLRDATLPEIAKPWSVISTDRDKPTLAKVTWADGVRGGKTSTGMYYRNDRGIYDEWHDGIGRLDSIESVEVLHTHDPVTHVPVERALIEAAAAWVEWIESGAPSSALPPRFREDIIRALASLASDESSASDGGQS